MTNLERTDPPLQGDERSTLLGFLDYQRDTLALKCAGLTPAQLAERALPPSTMSLLGLVRHLAEVERGWFSRLAGEKRPDIYCTPEQPDWDFDGAVADPEVVSQAFADWRAEIDIARAIGAATTLDATFVRVDRGEDFAFSHRWVLVHMVEEYARHNGHADLLRERIDGVTGE